MKTLINITLAASLSALTTQAQIVTDNLAQELNADAITTVTDGSTWTASTGGNATLKDTTTGALTKVAATVNGGQTSSVFANTLSKDSYERAGALGATTQFISGTTVSFELWINTGFTGEPTTSHTIFETGGQTRGLSITMGDNGSGTYDTLRFAVKDGGASAFVDYTLSASELTNFTNADHHQLAVTYDNANNMLLYIDGALKESNTTAGVVDWDGTSISGFWGQDGTGSGAESIGLDDDALTSTSAKGQGSIALFRHYSDVLTAGEVLQNYNTTIVPEPGSAALLAGCFALASVMIRRRR